jgi:hypothetical protein
MSTLPKVFYLSKSDHLPYYRSGKELHTVEFDRGWVEYLLQTSDLYFIRLSNNLLKKCRDHAMSRLTDQWLKKDQFSLGLIKKLATVRFEQEFDLPLFAHWQDPSIITCGTSRFTAEILHGIEADKIPVFFQTQKNQLPKELTNAMTVQSTQQAEELFPTDHLSYQLTFSSDASPVVMSSVLRDSVYNVDPDHSGTQESFIIQGQLTIDFWRKFTHNNRINITITCNKQSKQFINFDPTIWNVTFQSELMAGFSFAQILSKFNKPDDDQLNLYVYDISTTFDLLYLIPWTTTNSV